MTFFASISDSLEGLRARLGGAEVDSVTQVVAALDDDAVVAVLAEADQLAKLAGIVRAAASGVISARSSRRHGHAGLAQARGHRSAASLLQDLTGTTRAEAAKQVQLGATLLESSGIAAEPVAPTPDAGATGESEPDAGVHAALRTPKPWHAPLGRAITAQRISAEQHHAIRKGLGEPPVTEAGGAGDDSAASIDEVATRAAADAAAREAWSLAAEQLIDEAAHRTVEELGRAARALRDQLDPEGAERRYAQRFENRSFRQWVDEHGQHRASMVLDDHAALWLSSAIGAALRPRRGGPRFVDREEKARAEELVADTRDNNQLAYDLIIDVLKAGMLADAKNVFGTRQAGVRLVITHEAQQAATSGGAAIGIAEDDGIVLPAWVLSQHACESGTIECHLDRDGNPLYLGREQRLFSAKQRIALAIRDGGCRWKGCDRPPSYCEAHHIDQFDRDQGRTDIDRGILLCRFHHMQLHHGGWRITRDGAQDFLLHPPEGHPSASPIVLTPRLSRRYLWGDVDPPPQRFRAPTSTLDVAA